MLAGLERRAHLLGARGEGVEAPEHLRRPRERVGQGREGRLVLEERRVDERHDAEALLGEELLDEANIMYPSI